MNKKIFLMIVIILLTGCSANLDVNIEKDSISENLSLKADNEVEYNKIITWNGFPLPLYYDQELSNPFSDNEMEKGVSYYDVTNDNNNLTTSVSGTFNFENHPRSSLIRNCFRFYNISKDGDNYIFSTSAGLICSFDNFTLNVKTPYVIVDNNADYFDKENNTLRWTVNESNARKANIYFEVDFARKAGSENNSTTENGLQNEKSSSKNSYLFVIIILLVIAVLVMVYVLNKKKKKISDI